MVVAFGPLVVWGLSLAGGVGVVLGSVVLGVVLGGLAWWFPVVAVFSRPRGPAPPRCGRGGLLLFYSFLALAVGLLSQKKKKKKKKNFTCPA